MKQYIFLLSDICPYLLKDLLAEGFDSPGGQGDLLAVEIGAGLLGSTAGRHLCVRVLFGRRLVGVDLSSGDVRVSKK